MTKDRHHRDCECPDCDWKHRGTKFIEVPTGRHRHRKGFFGGFILEIECVHKFSTWEPDDSKGYSGFDYKLLEHKHELIIWRDAKEADIPNMIVGSYASEE